MGGIGAFGDFNFCLVIISLEILQLIKYGNKIFKIVNQDT